MTNRINLIQLREVQGTDLLLLQGRLPDIHHGDCFHSPHRRVKAVDGQMGFLTLESVTGMLEGGEPIIYEGQLIGAIGVSGAKSFEDAEIAQTAIHDFFQQIS